MALLTIYLNSSIMKTHKNVKYLIIAISLIMLPAFAQAAWWNPMTWFSVPETKPIIETQVSPVNSIDEKIETESESTPIETDIGSAQLPDKAVSSTQNTDSDSEINALKKEIQELRSVVQFAPTTNTVSSPVQQTSNNSVINEQVLETLSKLEQRVQTLESRTRNQDYDKVIARIESLEKKPATQTEDQSAKIKDIIGRVNLLSSAGIIDGCGNAGDQCWRPIICDAGNIASDKSGSYYENSLACKDLSDLKY